MQSENLQAGWRLSKIIARQTGKCCGRNRNWFESRLLMLNAGKAVTKNALLNDISLETPDCVEASLKVHISNLRKKIREFDETEYIESVWGIGFILKVPDR